MKKIISILLGICLCGGVFAQTQLKIISFNTRSRYRGFAGSRILYESNRGEYAEVDQ